MISCRFDSIMSRVVHTRGALARAWHLALWSAAIGFPTVAHAEDHANEPERPPTRAYLVADGDGFTIHPLGDHALVRADGLIAELSDQGLLSNFAFTKLPRLPSMSWLFGRWPDAVWLMQGSESTTRTNDYFAWKTGRWQLTTTLPSRSLLLQVLPQASGGFLVAFSDESPSGLELLPFGIDSRSIKPVPASATRKGCATKLSPVAVSGLPDGVVVAVGKVCSTVDPLLSVIRSCTTAPERAQPELVFARLAAVSSRFLDLAIQSRCKSVASGIHIDRFSRLPAMTPDRFLPQR